MKFVLDLRMVGSAGPVAPSLLSRFDDGASGMVAVTALAQEPRVTFLLHGFNVDRKQGREELGELANQLQGQISGALVATLWPGDSNLWALSYPFEGADADDAANHLAKFIVDYVPRHLPVSFVAHSLGCRVVLETVSQLVGETHQVDRVCLLAAAIDDFTLASENDYLEATVAAKRVAVMSSRSDRVLQLAYPVGDLLQAFLFVGDTPGAALGRRGPRQHRGTGVPGNVGHRPSEMKHGHGDYLPKRNPDAAQQARQADAADYACRVLRGDA